MTLQELRFFSIYLSKINKSNPEETRVVRFPMTDFQSIMELGRIDIGYIKNVTNSLLCKVVNVPIEDEKGKYRGYTGFQLFKECVVSQDDSGEWYVEIDAHDKALPLMFEFKNKYFSYQLWNALSLRSTNQLRMYEILKQYQTAGERILSMEDLRSLLGIGKDEYPRYNDFKKWVLDACQQALAEHTDIKFTYEPHGKKGRGGKILALKFTIKKNKDYTDQLTLDMFIEYNKDGVIEDDEDERERTPYEKRIDFFMDACNGEFTFDEVAILQDKMREHISGTQFYEEIFCYHYINDRYKYMNLQAKQRKIKNRFGYMRSLMGTEL
jgi:plasmid replication initiation protein